MAQQWSTVWITGASTGIGRELALQLAQAGVRVAASARTAAKLDELALLNPGILAVPLDVTDRKAVAAAHARIVSEIGPLDLCILNAGLWDPMSASDYDAARSALSMDVNYGGICNALESVLPPMLARGSGHVALVASVAGYRGLPKAAAYAPSKAAVISLAEVLKFDLEKRGIAISLINPGFVETPMTAVNDFPMPYMIQASDAAQRILAGLTAKKFEIAFPWQLTGALKALRVLPYFLYFRAVRLMGIAR